MLLWVFIGYRLHHSSLRLHSLLCFYHHSLRHHQHVKHFSFLRNAQCFLCFLVKCYLLFRHLKTTMLFSDSTVLSVQSSGQHILSCYQLLCHSPLLMRNFPDYFLYTKIYSQNCRLLICFLISSSLGNLYSLLKELLLHSTYYLWKPFIFTTLSDCLLFVASISRLCFFLLKATI